MVTFPNNFPRTGTSSWTRPAKGSDESYSGFARAGASEHLVVHDVKSPDGSRLSHYNSNSGMESVKVDWSRTELPEDLEAVAPLDGHEGEFLAVEGSRYNGRTPHMFLFDYAGGKAASVKQFDLPELPYEVEGLATKQRADGDTLVVLGGRGDGTSAEGRLHWGIYDNDQGTMAWTPGGVEGVPVSLPEPLGEGERPISDLHLTEKGDLWASGCVDEGDYGPFESLVYRVGTLDANAPSPVTLTLDLAQRIPGQKVEALDVDDLNGTHIFAGTDNEKLGGTLLSLIANV